ncbi:DUF5320 domain-containing protein [Pontiellaceae bacterium B12219]|nr:DUF5320 domain-containing protein [Pontiellaceae bacterium B12219]
MPAGDRTGPNGMGSMTGRGAGVCAGFATPGNANAGPGAGRGRGRRFGCGMGFGRQGAVAQSSDPQIDALKAQTKQLESQLNAVREQVQMLSSNAGE